MCTSNSQGLYPIRNVLEVSDDDDDDDADRDGDGVVGCGADSGFGEFNFDNNAGKLK